MNLVGDGGKQFGCLGGGGWTAAEGGSDAPRVRHNDCSLGSRARKGYGSGSGDSPHLPLLCLEQVRSEEYALWPSRKLLLEPCISFEFFFCPKVFFCFFFSLNVMFNA